MGLRPMRDGDDPRDIYWRRSTQPDQRLLRIRAEETNADISLTIDNIVDTTMPAEKWLERFEKQIRDVASSTVAHLRRGNKVRVSSATGETILSTPASGADRALTFLALLDSAPDEAVRAAKNMEIPNRARNEASDAVGPAPISFTSSRVGGHP
jgi:uncharacterized protein (DUF58 family)